MAKRCEICGKGPVVGRQVSHAHNVSARRFEPNLQTVRALVGTAVKRMLLLCDKHHRLVHEGGWRLVERDGGRFDLAPPWDRPPD